MRSNAMMAALAIATTLGGTAQAAQFYVMCDNGLRCIHAPCPSSNILDLATRRVSKGEIDLRHLTPADRHKVEVTQGHYAGTLVFEAMPGPNKRLVATRVIRPTTAGETRACKA